MNMVNMSFYTYARSGAQQGQDRHVRRIQGYVNS